MYVISDRKMRVSVISALTVGFMLALSVLINGDGYGMSSYGDYGVSYVPYYSYGGGGDGYSTWLRTCLFA